MEEADVQLELVKAKVAPLEHWWEDGVELQDGYTLPFLVERGWSGPAGHYVEEWWIAAGNGPVLFHFGWNEIFVHGPQSVSTFVDRVLHRIPLEPGRYHLAFGIMGLFMGAVDFDASPIEAGRRATRRRGDQAARPTVR